MKKLRFISVLVFIIAFGILTVSGLFTGCSNSMQAGTPDSNINLVFVITPDLINNAGDINPDTANLTNQGLQRAMKLGKYLKTNLLSSANVKGIYALEPCTHLQTANNYPDMVPLIIMEQFALLNQYTLWQSSPDQNLIAASFPINVSYTESSLPSVAGTPSGFHPECQGIDFADSDGCNEELVNRIIAKQESGYYVFAMPFETFKALIGNLKSLNSYGYSVPEAWQGPNIIYVLTIPTNSTIAALNTYDTQIKPGITYPEPSIPYKEAQLQQTPFIIQSSAIIGSVPPANINKNQTIHFIRHGEAHPEPHFENGNLVMQGNWRALYLPGALEGKIKTPDFVYSVDPAQAGPGMPESKNSGYRFYSYVRPSMTIAPYTIAKGLPLQLASGFQCMGFTQEEDAAQVEAAVKFFFTDGKFSNKTLLVAWEHDHIKEIAQSLVNQYFADSSNAPSVPSWPDSDYDTVWTFSFDEKGNLTISNSIYQGINSSTLPSTAPIYHERQ